MLDMVIDTPINRAVQLHAKAKILKKRRSDMLIYENLSECLEICEQVTASEDFEAFKEQAVSQIRDRRASAGDDRRVFFERDSDIYLVVGRLVFEGVSQSREAVWRYTATMREAAQRGIKSQGFTSWLSESGGINALFKSRCVAAASVKTKTLHLNSAIEVPKGEPITITIQRAPNGFFDVVAS